MTIGINVLQGSSPENALAWVKATKPRYCVVINEPSIAARLQAHTQVVYRVKSASDDDHALDYDPVTFVHRRHLEAPPGALIALSNEPGRGSLASLNDWTLDALKACNAIGRRAVAINMQTGNPEPADWIQLRECMAFARKHNHILGLHEYFWPTPIAARPWHIGRYVFARQVLGKDCPEILITELGYAHNGDAYRGYRDYLSASDYAAHLVTIGGWYRADGILGACVFAYGSLPPWESFDIAGQPGITQAIALFNAQGGGKVALTWNYGAPVEGAAIQTTAPLNVRKEADTSAAILTTVSSGDVVTYWQNVSPTANDGHQWWKIQKGGVTGFIAATYVTGFTDPPADGWIKLPELYLPDDVDRTAVADVLDAVSKAIRTG